MAPWTDRHRRLLALVYLGGAVALVPWIVLLALTQVVDGQVERTRLVATAIPPVVAAAMVVASLLWWRRSRRALLAASFSGSFSFAALWFRLASGVGGT